MMTAIHDDYDDPSLLPGSLLPVASTPALETGSQPAPESLMGRSVAWMRGAASTGMTAAQRVANFILGRPPEDLAKKGEMEQALRDVKRVSAHFKENQEGKDSRLDMDTLVGLFMLMALKSSHGIARHQKRMRQESLLERNKLMKGVAFMLGVKSVISVASAITAGTLQIGAARGPVLSEAALTNRTILPLAELRDGIRTRNLSTIAGSLNPLRLCEGLCASVARVPQGGDLESMRRTFQGVPSSIATAATTTKEGAQLILEGRQAEKQLRADQGKSDADDLQQRGQYTNDWISGIRNAWGQLADALYRTALTIMGKG